MSHRTDIICMEEGRYIWNRTYTRNKPAYQRGCNRGIPFIGTCIQRPRINMYSSVFRICLCCVVAKYDPRCNSTKDSNGVGKALFPLPFITAFLPGRQPMPWKVIVETLFNAFSCVTAAPLWFLLPHGRTDNKPGHGQTRKPSVSNVPSCYKSSLFLTCQIPYLPMQLWTL